MHSFPFDKPGRWYRGNLHAHTTNSDGRLSPEAVVAAYRAQGYDFVAITDHWTAQYGFPITDTRALRTEDFTTLIGAELHGPGLAGGEIWHIVAAGLPFDFPPLAPGETGPDVARRAYEAGAWVGIAHPAWYGVTPEEMRTIATAHAVEVYNETCARLNDRGESWYVTDMLLREGRRLHAYAADDAHFRERPDAFGAWVMVRAGERDPDALLAALKAGHYYASTGPQLHDIAVADEHLRIVCSPASAIYLTGPGWPTCFQHGTAMTEARFPLDQFPTYCRVTVVDAGGGRAWSNPIWRD